MSGIVEATDYELEDTPWATRAACAGSNGDVFFTKQGGSTREARSICAACPVTTECLAYALRWSIGFGVWGGLTPRQRRAYTARPPRRLPPFHGTTARYSQGCQCQRCMEAHAQQ